MAARTTTAALGPPCAKQRVLAQVTMMMIIIDWRLGRALIKSHSKFEVSFVYSRSKDDRSYKASECRWHVLLLLLLLLAVVM